MNPGAAVRHRWLGCLTVGHALLVAIVPLAVPDSVESVPIMIGPWLILAWGWLAWPLVLIRHPGRSVLRTVLPLVISLVLMSSCIAYVVPFTPSASSDSRRDHGSGSL
jgi:hypothetical protein